MKKDLTEKQYNIIIIGLMIFTAIFAVVGFWLESKLH